MTTASTQCYSPLHTVLSILEVYSFCLIHNPTRQYYYYYYIRGVKTKAWRDKQITEGHTPNTQHLAMNSDEMGICPQTLSYNVVCNALLHFCTKENNLYF
jgi:hypothetical protein